MRIARRPGPCQHLPHRPRGGLGRTVPRSPAQTKECLHCGRPFADRKRWASRGQWEAVHYCSVKCRAAARRARGPA
ncbi:DUF2256 domain-containing protein [Microbacterium pygmaeum]|uniref:DUF2256 domain-containing protein n=1 Tax=Microbacterium pygmaeum TaxID=370764 RepID=UPI000B8715D8